MLSAPVLAQVSVNDFIVRAVALALVDVPGANAQWDAKSGEVVPCPGVDIAIAVATDKGLITPIVRGAAAKSLTQISAEARASNFLHLPPIGWNCLSACATGGWKLAWACRVQDDGSVDPLGMRACALTITVWTGAATLDTSSLACVHESEASGLPVSAYQCCRRQRLLRAECNRAVGCSRCARQQ